MESTRRSYRLSSLSLSLYFALSIIVAFGSPLEFIRMAQGYTLELQEPVYSVLLVLVTIMGACPLIGATWLYGIRAIEQWERFLLSRPVVTRRLSELERDRRNYSKLLARDARSKELAAMVANLKIKTDPGFIYVMRRVDGIYKLGRSTNPNRRLMQHTEDYGKDFQLIRRFVVPDVIIFEKLALKMTKAYYHQEPGRNELRQMSDEQLEEFMLEFEQVAREATVK